MSQEISYKTQENVSVSIQADNFIRSAKEGYKILCGLSPRQKYPPGVELFPQGSQAKNIYFIESGVVKLTSLYENGQELIVSLRSEGQLVGTASVILQKQYSLQATTLTYCNLGRISAEIFLHTLATSIEFSCYVQQAHGREIDDQITQVVELVGYSARNRLERFLWMFIPQNNHIESNESICLRIPLKQWEIAQVLAITPAYLSRLLNQLESEEILERKNGSIIILDAKRLCLRDLF